MQPGCTESWGREANWALDPPETAVECAGCRLCWQVGLVTLFQDHNYRNSVVMLGSELLFLCRQ